MLPLQGMPGGRWDAARSGLRSVPASNGSTDICVGCCQAPCLTGLPDEMKKSLELRANCFWDKKAAGQTRRRQKYYPGPFLCAELS